MTLRSNTRTFSHVAIVALIALLLWLGWRLDYDLGWMFETQTEPMFAPEDLPPLVASSEEAQEAPVAAEPDSEEPLSEPPESEPAPFAESASASLAEPAPASAPEPASSPQAEADPEVAALFEAWARARQLLRQRDLAGAEVAYLGLTERWPRHPDLIGELGNVYGLLGELEPARAAFQKARVLLEPMGPSLQLKSVTRWLEQNE